MYDGRIAAAGEEACRDRVPGARLVVGRALEHDGESAVERPPAERRQVDVGGEARAVAQRHPLVRADGVVVRERRAFVWRDQRCELLSAALGLADSSTLGAGAAAVQSPATACQENTVRTLAMRLVG